MIIFTGMVTSFLKKLKQWLPFLTRIVFLWSLVIYFVFLLIETLKKGWLRAYFYDINMDIFLVIVIILGIVFISFNYKTLNDKKTKSFGLFITSVLAIGSGLIIYFKLKEFGLPGIIMAISAIPIIFVVLCSYNYSRKESD